AREPLDQPLERHYFVSRLLRFPLLISDRLEWMFEARRARARERVGVRTRNEAVGHHQLQDIVETKRAIDGRYARRRRSRTLGRNGSGDGRGHRPYFTPTRPGTPESKGAAVRPLAHRQQRV